MKMMKEKVGSRIESQLLTNYIYLSLQYIFIISITLGGSSVHYWNLTALTVYSVYA